MFGATSAVTMGAGAGALGAMPGMVTPVAAPLLLLGAGAWDPAGMITCARSMAGQGLPAAPVVMPVVRRVSVRPLSPPALTTRISVRLAGISNAFCSVTPTCRLLLPDGAVPAATPSSESTFSVCAWPVALSTNSRT